MRYLTIFLIIIAAIIAVTRVILSIMEERDRARGIPTNHKEYTIGGLLGIMFKDWLNDVKNWFKTKKRKRNEKKEEK